MPASCSGDRQGQPDPEHSAGDGGRFRPISPYIQDNWKITSKLTLNLGLRWDYYPTYTEAHNVLSFFNPTLTNPITNTPGAIQYAGNGANTCNCSTPVSNYMKNFGPRLGLAYQIDPKTVIRASYGVMYTHGNGVGGSAISRTGTGTLGFSASPSDSSNTSTFLSSAPFPAFPAYIAATGTASGNGYGTGYTTTAATPVRRRRSAMAIPIWADAHRSTSTTPWVSSTSGPTISPRRCPMWARRATS